MAEGSDEERTEEPTEKRRQEFRDEGQVAQSKEVNTALILSAALLLWYFYAPLFWKKFENLLSKIWEQSAQYSISSGSLVNLLIVIVRESALLLCPLLLLVVVAGFFASYVQIGWLFTLKPLQPDPSKLDPIKGVARLVSMRSLVEMGKSMAKVLIVAALAYYTLISEIKSAILLVDQSLDESIAFIGIVAGKILLKSCLVLMVLAVLDYLYTRWEMEQKMKMTKKELKDEQKETEGDPQIKQKIRSIQKQMAQKRMMAEVPKSDVVITNPTYIAVALTYKKEEMDAPQIVAKGTDNIALQIRKLARENEIPIVENPPVARTLNNIEIGQPIPEEMYKAVAEIFAYVYSLKRKKK